MTAVRVLLGQRMAIATLIAGVVVGVVDWLSAIGDKENRRGSMRLLKEVRWGLKHGKGYKHASLTVKCFSA